MFMNMEQLDLDTPSTEVSSERGRFPCPSCGSMLRNGAILCPYCDARFRKPAYGEAEVSSVAVADRGEAPPTSTSRGGQPASRSLVIATIALAAEVVVFVTAGALPGSSALPALLALGPTLLAVYAVNLARHAEHRIDDTGGGRPLKTARYGLILGMATIAFAASWFVTWSIDLLITRIQP